MQSETGRSLPLGAFPLALLLAPKLVMRRGRGLPSGPASDVALRVQGSAHPSVGVIGQGGLLRKCQMSGANTRSPYELSQFTVEKFAIMSDERKLSNAFIFVLLSCEVVKQSIPPHPLILRFRFPNFGCDGRDERNRRDFRERASPSLSLLLPPLIRMTLPFPLCWSTSATTALRRNRSRRLMAAVAAASVS